MKVNRLFVVAVVLCGVVANARDPNYDEAKVASYKLEDPLAFADGRKLKDAIEWPARRKEILEIFAREMYGKEPPAPEAVVTELREEGPTLAGLAIRRQYRMWFKPDKSGPFIDWLLVLPNRVAETLPETNGVRIVCENRAKVPVVLMLNFPGNHAVLDDAEVRLTEGGWFRADGDSGDHGPKESNRGVLRRSQLRTTVPAEFIVARGYAFLTACYAQVSPDVEVGKGDPEELAYTRVFELWGKRDESRTDNTTALGAWAWALSRGLDLAETIPEIDAKRCVATGSSRLGKAALLASARDERFAVCVPNQTGGGGVPLAKRDFGENISTEMAMFPHWYCKAYAKYIDNEQAMKFDQHLLVAAIAPRALLVEGFNSGWFDPKGEWLSCRAASPVWEFLGKEGLPKGDFPENYDLSCVGSSLGYVRRGGQHGLSGYDWLWMLDFADKALAEVALTADFSQEVGPIRPEIHSSGFGPTICSQTEQDLADLKSMGFKYARTHDWALINPNQRVCDYFHIFPLMHLDAKDPKNYIFGPTDYLLKRTREEMGSDVFFRLGTSIEHSGKKVHFNSLMPEDFDKVAEIFAATVRHYNRGWADGYNWNIKYWEIWNEPEGIQNMWAPPEGAAGKDGNWTSDQRSACRARFVKFYVTVLKRLKDEFGDEIKVGGPALTHYNLPWIKDILVACRDTNVAPDFISWHGYVRDPMQFTREAEMARKLCDSYGFEKCELILDEWHYFGENYSWTDIQSSDPAVKARVWDGPDSHNGIRSACFSLSALANLERSKMTQAYFYGCKHAGNWGFKDELQRKYKVFYALRLFGDIVKGYSAICASESVGSITLFPVKDASGRKALLVVDYGGVSRQISVKVAGVPEGATTRCVLLDNLHDLAPHKVAFKDGLLELVKPDFHSAAFFVIFGE